MPKFSKNPNYFYGFQASEKYTSNCSQILSNCSQIIHNFQKKYKIFTTCGGTHPTLSLPFPNLGNGCGYQGYGGHHNQGGNGGGY